MTTSLTRGLWTAVLAVGTLSLAACTGSSTPATAVGAPTPAPPAPPSPEPLDPCTDVSLDVRFLGQGEAAGIGRGELTLHAKVPEVGLDIAAPYTIQVPEGGANLDISNLRPTIGVFLSNLGFSSLDDGFQQTMTVEWLSNLEIRAGTEGCEPVTVSCNLAGCSGS